VTAYAYYAPLLLSLAFGLVAPRLACRLPPRAATWFLSSGGALLATTSSLALALLSFAAVGQIPLVASLGKWSDDLLQLRYPLSAPIGALALILVIGFAVRFVQVGSARVHATRAAYRLAATLPRQGSELSLLDVDTRRAYAVPGRPGCIVVTRGMLHELDAKQRRALLAHERAHLVYHHHVHHTVVHLAIAANPLLRPIRPAVELACERWADEVAAQTCPRAVVAAALTHAAIGRQPGATGIALCAAAMEVGARIQALRAPRPRLKLWPLLIVNAIDVSSVVFAVLAWRHTEGLFELAQHAYRAGQR
jgi:Peptidase family M48